MSLARFPALAALGAVLLLADRASAGPQTALIEAKAPTVVSLKITAKLTGSRGGQSFDREQNLTSSGVVVDAGGLVMMPAGAISVPKQFRADFKVTPTNIRVIFPGDEKEYDAVLGATDTKLGLAYVLIRDLAGRTATCVDFGKTVEPVVGQEYFSVTRHGQGFDYAPVCQKATLIGTVTKPRQMWSLDGQGTDPGYPLYDADGAVAGIMVSQEGVGDNAQELTFLLPLKVAKSSIERSLKAAQKELEDVKAREAEAAAKAKEKEAEKPADKPADAPADKPADAPAEKPAEKPSEPAPAPSQPK